MKRVLGIFAMAVILASCVKEPVLQTPTPNGSAQAEASVNVTQPTAYSSQQAATFVGNRECVGDFWCVEGYTIMEKESMMPGGCGGGQIYYVGIYGGGWDANSMTQAECSGGWMRKNMGPLVPAKQVMFNRTYVGNFMKVLPGGRVEWAQHGELMTGQFNQYNVHCYGRPGKDEAGDSPGWRIYPDGKMHPTGGKPHVEC